MLPRFNANDADRAYDEWGSNCGPGALAAITGLTLDEVRPHLVGFDTKHYTNPTMMFDALKSIGIPHVRIGSKWPRYGLARIQWEGPWTEPGVPMRVRYRYTHWIGVWGTEDRGVGVFDINEIGNGTGWVKMSDWSDFVVPRLTNTYKRATGNWHITHGVEVQRREAFDAQAA